MKYPDLFLQEQIEKAYRRWRRGIWIRGLTLCLMALPAGFGAILLTRPFWPTAPWIVPILAGLTLLLIFYFGYRSLILPLRRKVTAAMIARSIEQRHPELEDRLVTAVDLSEAQQKEMTTWVRLVVQDAVSHITGVNVLKPVQIRGYRLWQGGLILAASAILMGFLLRQSWQVDVDALFKSGFKPLKPPPEFKVTPGDAKVRKGEQLNIKALLSNFTPAEGMIFMNYGDSSWTSDKMQYVASGEEFQYSLYDIEDSLRYYVRLGDEISDIYHVSVYDAPAIRRIDLTYIYPENLQLPRRYERDGGDIWAPVGTEVRLRVTTTWPVVSAELQQDKHSAKIMQLINDTTAVSALKIQADGLYRIRLRSREGLDNSPLMEYYIHAIENQPPVLTLVKPSRDYKATMLEEIPVVAEVTDDFGVQKVQMAYAINATREKFVSMHVSGNTETKEGDLSLKTKRYEQMLYLEDLKVRPGDFISVYVEAIDPQLKTPVTSDIYFIEVRNFEEIYVLSTSAAQGGGTGGMPNSLSQLQKEIILATHKLIRLRDTLQKQPYQQNLDNLKTSQENLRKNIQQISRTMRMRLNFVPDDGKKIIKHLDLAIQAMKKAEPLIGKDSLQAALIPEREAFHQLLRADVMIRKRQITRSSGGRGSSAPRVNRDELSQLFHDEMDKLKNKYETLQQGDRQQAQAQVDEALRKIRELAQRQQRLNEMNRRLAQNNLSAQEKKREIKKLQRQQEQLKRDMRRTMEQMARDMRASGAADSESLRRMQQASSAMNQAMNRLQKQDPQNAAANGQQALNQLKQLEDRLRKQKRNALRNELERMQNQLNQLAQSQKGLRQKTHEMQQKSSANFNELRKQLSEQQQLRQQTEASLNRFREMIRGVQDNPALKRELEKAYKELQRAGARQKMQQSEQALRLGQFKQAENLQKQAEKALSQGAQKLGQSLAKLDHSREDKLEMALKQAHELRKNLEQQLQKQPGGQPSKGRQAASTDRQKSVAQNNSQRGGPGNPPTSQEYLTENQLNKWREMLWNTQKQLKDLQQNYLRNDTTLQQSSQQLINQLHGIVRTFKGGDPQRMQQIQKQIVDPLRRFEAELATRLQLLKGKETLRTVLEEEMPPNYKELIEAYYRSLAREK